MKRSYLILAFAIFILSAGIVAAQSADLPGAGWFSGQQIQNVGTGNADIVFSAYDTSGTEYSCGSNSNVAPGASVNYLTADCPVAAGFTGSAVVSANQPIAAIVNVTNAGTGSAAGQYRGTSAPATTVNFPIAKNNFIGRTTTFYVQNAGTAANVTANFTTTSGTYSNTYNNIPANAMVVITPADAGVPNGELGSLSVTSSSALAGSSLEHEHNVAVGTNLQASTGFTSADEGTTLYCPLYRRDHTNRNFSTGLQVQNVSGSTASVTFTYNYDGGTATDTQSIAAGASYTWFNQGPSGSVGSATVTSNQNVVAVVSDRGFAATPSPVTAYSCFSAANATNEVVIPLYKEFFFGNSTGIQVQNVGTGTASISVTYSPNGGSPVTLNGTVPAGESTTFFGVSQGLAPAGISGGSSLSGTFGGVTISSNEPIVAVVNESSFAGAGSGASGQDNKNYEGFNR